MINVFEALKSEGLVYQDPNDPSGSTWVMSQDADGLVEKVEKLVDYAWKTGRRYQLMELTTNKKLGKKDDYFLSGGFAEGEDKKIEGYNQAIDDYEKIFQEEEDSIFPEPDNTPVPIQVSARFRPNPNDKSWWTEKEEAACVEISKMRDEEKISQLKDEFKKLFADEIYGIDPGQPLFRFRESSETLAEDVFRWIMEKLYE